MVRSNLNDLNTQTLSTGTAQGFYFTAPSTSFKLRISYSNYYSSWKRCCLLIDNVILSQTTINSNTVCFKDKYRFGFNGKEKDDEVKGEGNQQNYGMRIYDPRLGKFLSLDPLTKEYPMLTPYQFAGNMPIQAIDLDGLEPAFVNEMGFNVLGSDHNFNGNPFFVPKLIVPTKRSVAEDVFPTENKNLSANLKVSVGYKKLSQDLLKIEAKSDDNSKNGADVKEVRKTDNKQSLLILEGGTEFITKTKWVTGDVVNPYTGDIISKDKPFPLLVTEKNQSLGVGVFSIETREVFVNFQKQKYQFRIGLGKSIKNFKIGMKEKSVEVDVNAEVSTDWENVSTE